MALANVTEGAARATVLKVTQAEPNRGFVAWQALVDGYAPKSSNDPTMALHLILATPKRSKDAKELKASFMLRIDVPQPCGDLTCKPYKWRAARPTLRVESFSILQSCPASCHVASRLAQVLNSVGHILGWRVTIICCH